MNMAATWDDEKPWKMDLARRSARRREQILHQVFGYGTDADSRALDTHMKNLRRKLGSSDWFETVHGQGYRLAAPVTE